MRQGGFFHNLFVGLVVLAASITFVLSSVAAWTHQTVLGTDRFVTVVTDATSKPQVIDSLGARLADQVVVTLGLEQRLTNVLPPALDRLAAPLTQAVHDRIETATVNLLSDPTFQTHFASLIAELHTGVLNIIDGNAQYFTTTNGKLTLDLTAVIDTVITQLQTDGVLPTAADFPRLSAAADRSDYLAKLGSYLQTQLPPDFGQIPIMDASSVDSVGMALDLFDQALVGLAVLTGVLALAGVLLAHRHWNTIAWLGTAIEFWLALLIIGLLYVQRYSSDVVANPDNRVLLGALTGSLANSLTLWLAAIGVAVLFILLPTAFLARHSNRKAAARAQQPSATA